MSPPGRQSYPEISALQRGLTILAEIGQNGSDVAMLAEKTGINRTTIYRILATLEQGGYLTRSPANHHYRLAPKVRRLSDGYTDALWITHIATPALMELLRITSWPSSIATFDGRHMVFRESTHRFSSYFMHKPMIGLEVPLSTALGQAFLAFSAESVRKPMLPSFIADWQASGFGDITVANAERMMTKIRKRGHASAIGPSEPSIAAIAMPIKRAGQVLACINIAMTREVFHSPALLRPIRDELASTVEKIQQRMEMEWS